MEAVSCESGDAGLPRPAWPVGRAGRALRDNRSATRRLWPQACRTAFTPQPRDRRVTRAQAERRVAPDASRARLLPGRPRQPQPARAGAGRAEDVPASADLHRGGRRLGSVLRRWAAPAWPEGPWPHLGGRGAAHQGTTPPRRRGPEDGGRSRRGRWGAAPPADLRPAPPPGPAADGAARMAYAVNAMRPNTLHWGRSPDLPAGSH
jgi:hypothetical protein